MNFYFFYWIPAGVYPSESWDQDDSTSVFCASHRKQIKIKIISLIYRTPLEKLKGLMTTLGSKIIQKKFLIFIYNP